MRISDWSSDVCSSDLDPIDAGHQNARHRIVAAHAGIEAETPQRAGQIGLRPGLAQLFLAARDRRLEPAVPAVDEGTAEPPMDEVPLRRNLAVEARRTCRRLSCRRSEEHTS